MFVFPSPPPPTIYHFSHHLPPLSRHSAVAGHHSQPSQKALGWHLDEIHVTWLIWGRNRRDYNSTPKSKKKKRIDSRDVVANL
nr:hypothetical protein [Tanacetum cinerariifolium]